MAVSNSLEQEALKQRTLGSVLWMVVATGWASVASFVTFAVLARLLDPFTFGTFGLAQSMFLVVTAVISSGFNDVIIQRRDLTEKLADTLFWANLTFALFAAGIVWVTADLYAKAIEVPEAGPPLRCLAFAIPLEALATVHLARSLREFSHKVVALRTFASTLIGGGLAIVAALNGLSIWSLVLQVWATSFLNAVFAWGAFRWLPRLRFSWSSLVSVVPYCGSVMITRFLWALLGRIPEVVLGRFWGAAAVGHYRVGSRLIELISNSVLQPLSNVAFSTFSSLNGDRTRTEAAYLRLLNGGAIVGFPLLLGCGVLAEDLIKVLFGAKWTESAIVVQIMALMAVPQVLGYLIGPTLSASASMKGLTVVAAIQVAAAIVLSILAAPYGLAAVSAAYVAGVYAVAPYQQYLLYQSIGVSLAKCGRAVRNPLVASFVMIAALYTLSWALHPYLSKGVFHVGIMVTVGALIYGLCLYTLDKHTIKFYIRMIVGNLK